MHWHVPRQRICTSKATINSNWNLCFSCKNSCKVLTEMLMVFLTRLTCKIIHGNARSIKIFLQDWDSTSPCKKNSCISCTTNSCNKKTAKSLDYARYLVITCLSVQDSWCKNGPSSCALILSGSIFHVWHHQRYERSEIRCAEDAIPTLYDLSCTCHLTVKAGLK